MHSVRISSTICKHVRERAQGICEYCRTPDSFANYPFYCEHIIPERMVVKLR